MPKISRSILKNKNFLALAGNAIISLLGFVQWGLIYRAFTIEDTGTWIFFTITLGIFDAIRNGFLGTATIKFYAGADANRAANVLGTVWCLAFLITGIFIALNAGAFMLLPFIHNFQVIVSIKWVGITLLSSLTYSVIFWKLQADEHYATILWMRFVNSGSTILSFLLLLFVHRFTLQNALLWNFITNSLTSVAGLVAGLGGLKNIAARSKRTASEIMHFGKYSMGTNLVSNLLRAVDTYIVIFMLGPEALAILSVPSKLMELVDIPLRSFVGTGMSGMAVAFNQKNMQQFRRILYKYAGMLTLVFIPMAIAVFFLADIPVNVLSSGKYSGTAAANIYRFVMFTAIIYPIDRFNGVALDIIHQPKINFQKVQLMLLFKVAGNIAFIYLLGNIYGVPIAGVFTMIAGLVFGAIRLRKFTEFNIPAILSTGFYELKALAKVAGRE